MFTRRNKFSIVVYTGGRNNKIRLRLQDTVKTTVPGKNLEFFHTMKDLSGRLHRIPREIDVAVLLAQKHHEIEHLILLNPYLDDTPIILILPDRNQETFSKGCKIRPIFTDYVDTDFSNVAAVLEKIYHRHFDYTKIVAKTKKGSDVY